MLVGRNAELAAIDRLLAAAREGRSGVLVLRGEAGVGKSAVLEHAVALGDEFTILRCTGVEVESELAYAALHQLLRPVFDRIDLLPEPQAAALRAAFALSSETVDERFRVSAGVLALLAAVAEERPLLCLVDDAQWLDRASSDALLFAARRLEADAVALLFAARANEAAQSAGVGLPELQVSALRPEEARELLRERLGRDTSPTAVEWLIEHANGIPLALMELPELLSTEQLHGRDAVAETLPPPTSVEQVYLERVQALPPPTRTLLLIAAAESTGDRVTIARAAAELGIDATALAKAESVGLLQVDSERVEFRHPLVRSAVYRGSGFVERERVHHALAAALDGSVDADRRAWHRAAATIGADAELADELERTAERAARRSGHAAAAAALRRAAELSADPQDEGRRLVAAARAAWRAGQPERATALLDAARPIVSEPALLAELDHVNGEIQFRCGVLLDACETLMAGAAQAAASDPRKALEMLFDAANAGVDAGDYARVADAARRAADLPRSDDDEDTLLVDLLVGVGSLLEGKSAHEAPRVLEVIARADEFDEPRWLVWAGGGAGALGDDAKEAELLRRAVARARATAVVNTLTLALQALAVEAVVAGRHTATEAAEGLRLARETGLRNPTSVYLAVLAWFAAVSGDDASCRAYAAEVAEAARVSGHGLANSISEWAVALLDLGRGRPGEAMARLDALRAAPPGVGHPYVVLVSTPDLVEACVRSRHTDAAASAFTVLEAFAQPGAPTWTRALAARCRALQAPAADAEEHFQEALRLHGLGDRAFDRARTELLFGELLRRDRRRTHAREHLRAAADIFERLGAEAWAERARGELRASGESARKRDPSTAAQLTPQELQIARLASEGRSNKEIAAQLFLSPRTIEYHLRKVFMKLGISSRSELIRDGVEPEPAVA